MELSELLESPLGSTISFGFSVSIGVGVGETDGFSSTSIVGVWVGVGVTSEVVSLFPALPKFTSSFKIEIMMTPNVIRSKPTIVIKIEIFKVVFFFISHSLTIANSCLINSKMGGSCTFISILIIMCCSPHISI